MYAPVQGSSQSSKRGLPLFSQCSALMWTQNLPPPYFSAGWIHAYTCTYIRCAHVRVPVWILVHHVCTGMSCIEWKSNSSNGHCCGFFWYYLHTWLSLYVPTSFSYIICQNSKLTRVVSVQCQWANGLFDCMGLWLVYSVQIVALLTTQRFHHSLGFVLLRCPQTYKLGQQTLCMDILCTHYNIHIHM